MKQFYLKNNDRIEGPYEREELIYLHSQGELPPEAKVREGELGNWTPAAQLLGINNLVGYKKIVAHYPQVSGLVPYKTFFVKTRTRVDSRGCKAKETYKVSSPQR